MKTSFCAVQHSENAIVIKAIQSDEIVEQHALEFLVQVLVPIRQSGEIASIDAVCRGELRNAPKGTWVLNPKNARGSI